MRLHFHLCVVCLMLASLYQGRNSLCQRGPTTGRRTEFLWPASFLTIDGCVDVAVGNLN